MSRKKLRKSVTGEDSGYERFRRAINPETFDEHSSSKSQVSINSRVRQLNENSFAQRLGVTGHGSNGEVVNLAVF